MKQFIITALCLCASYNICAHENSFTGDGTESSPFIISEKEDLIFLADTVNNCKDFEGDAANVFAGKYFRLNNDIDMSGVKFSPIGNKFSQCFGGTFDGDGKTIQNLTISTGSDGYAGLFGRVSASGIIKNLNISDAKISTTGICAGGIAADCAGYIENCTVKNINLTNSYQFTGGIAGRAQGKISNVSVSGYIEGGENSVGGITGQNYDSIYNAVCNADVVSKASSYSCTVGGISGCCYLAASVISGCSFGGTVSCLNDGIFIGGITGNLYKGRVEKSFSTGTCKTESSSSVIGGIVGRTDDGTIENCYNSGVIYSPFGSSTVGGIAGTVNDAEYHTTISCCYNAGIVISDTYFYDPKNEIRELFGSVSENASISNVFFDKQMVSYGSEINYGKTTIEMTSGNGLEGFSPEVWYFTEGMYPRLSELKNHDIAIVSASPIFLSQNDNTNSVSKDFTLSEHSEWFTLNNNNLQKDGHGFHIEGANALLYDRFAADTLVCKKNGYCRYLLIKTSYVPFDGEGTVESPYLIKTKEDLIVMAEATNNNGETYEGRYFILQNDIDMNSSNFSGISSDEFNSKPFAGVFDGGGHYIHNMTMQKVCFDEEGNADFFNSYGYGGFFGQVSSKGIIRNLNISDDCSFSFLYLSGGIVGYNNGLVQNCINSAPIEAYSYSVGGIVGENLADGHIVSCLNNGNITASQWSAGGIVGTTSGDIEKCMNTGNVTSVIRGEDKGTALGGIAGSVYDTNISNCVNAGSIYGDIETGGIIGAVDGISTISNSFNYGMVGSESQSEVGQIAGAVYSSAVFNNVFYDNQIQQTVAIGDGDAKNINGLPALSMMYPIENFDTNIWNFGEGHYPYISTFKGITCAEGAAHSIIVFSNTDTAYNIEDDAILGSYNGLEWTLCENRSFIIDGNKLIPYTSGSDTLTAQVGGYVKKIPIKTDRTVAIEGNVTEKKIINKEYFTPTGIKIQETSVHDIYIIKVTYEDGTYAIYKYKNR